MFEKLFLLTIGFLLTTVCGGILGRYFQHRTWKNQWAVSQNERTIQLSLNIFEEISRLMDKRLYRMRRLYWAINKNQSNDEVENRMNEYREVLYEWNDNINRNLALLQFYFGDDSRDSLDFDVGKMFVDTGAILEKNYRQRRPDEKLKDIIDSAEDLDILASKVYQFNLNLLGKIKKES